MQMNVENLISQLDSEGYCDITDKQVEALIRGYAELEAQAKQLTAENAKLADCANFYRLGFKPVKGAFGIEYRPTEQLLDDCGNTALEAIKTPATDYILASLRAEGVDMLLSYLPPHYTARADIEAFAAQLRSQSEQVKGENK